jgi:hypothetical protein
MWATTTLMLIAKNNFSRNAEYDMGFSDFYTTFFVDRSYTWVRKFDVKKREWVFDEEDGYPRLMMPLTDGIDEKIKDGSRIVFDQDAIVVNWYSNYNLPETTGKEKKAIFSGFGIQQSIVNVLKNHSNKNIYMSQNDVLVDGKKIYGGEDHGNKVNYFGCGTVMYDIDEQRFAYEMITDKNHHKRTRVETDEHALNITKTTGEQVYSSMTTIKREIPGLSKEEFVRQLHKQMELIYNMSKAY